MADKTDESVMLYYDEQAGDVVHDRAGEPSSEERATRHQGGYRRVKRASHSVFHRDERGAFKCSMVPSRLI